MVRTRPNIEGENRRALLAAIIESASDAIQSGTLDSICTSWNTASERMYGYSAKEMIGQSFSCLNAPENINEELENQRKIRNGQTIEPYETFRIRKDGSIIPISLTISPIYDESGTVIGSSGIARNITQDKHLIRTMASLVESSYDAIVGREIDGKIISWNPAAERIFGYLAQEVIGQTVSPIVAPEFIHEDIENQRKIRDGIRIEPYETVRTRKDGSTVSISLTISPIYNEIGAIIGSSGIACDITLEKLAAQNARNLASIVESSNDAITSRLLDGTYTSWNAAAERMFGFSAKEILGQPFSPLIPSEKTFETAENLSKIRNGIEIDPYETVRIRKDGRHIPILLTISPIFDGNNVVIGSSASVRDITEQKEQMRQLVTATEQRNEFVAMVAHDIRSPATSISGFSHLLIDRWGSINDLKKLDHLKVIARKAEQLANFVEDVLHVSRIEAGEFNLELGEFDICELVQEALLEIAGPDAGQRFHFIAAQEIPLVFGDKERQLEVLMNLLTNAAKFSPETEQITIKLASKKDWLEVSVIDHGIGVLKADQHKLFQKFARLHQPGLQKVPGTGLGLFICKNLVEAQGGRIWYENVPNQGSTFTYTIPISGVSTPITGISAKTVAPFRVLVVEDDPDMGQLIQAALSTDPRLEYIGQAAKADEAVALALKLSPALVILDHQIDGDIHGLQAAPMIKSISPESRIILFTSQEIAVEAGREPAIDLFLSKSEINKLAAAAQQVLGLSPLV